MHRPLLKKARIVSGIVLAVVVVLFLLQLTVSGIQRYISSYRIGYAAEKGDCGEIRRLLRNGADVNARAGSSTITTDTVLIIAIRNHRSDAVKLLLDNGANPYIGDDPRDGGEDAFQYALMEGDYRSFTYVMKYADSYACQSYLRCASSIGDTDKTEFFIDSGVDVNSRDPNGQTPLFKASTVEVAQLLVSHGALVDIRDNKGRSPYIAAAQDQRDDVAEYLRGY